MSTEQNDDRTLSRCPAATTYEAWEQHGGYWHAIGTMCRQWSCPYCGPKRTKQLCTAIARARPNRFLTLTAGRPAGRTPREVWDDTRRMVPELIRHLRKEYGPIEYCRVLEAHKSGYPHYHLLARAPWIDQQGLSRAWESLTDAFIVDIRKVDPDRRVDKYIAKYLTKTTSVPFTARRVTSSRGFFLPADAHDKGDVNYVDAQRHDEHVRDFVEAQYKGFKIDWITEGHAVRLGQADEPLPPAEMRPNGNTQWLCENAKRKRGTDWSAVLADLYAEHPELWDEQE